MRGLRGAIVLLTRIPAGGNLPEASDPASSVRWFPLVGAAVGAVVGVAYALLAQVLPSLVAGLIAVVIGIMVTGGLHEDGLGDVADAFGGGNDPAEVARILKDPRQGTFGVIAIAGALFLRADALGSMSPVDGLAMAVAAHSIGRTAIVVAMRLHPPAGTGLAASYARNVTPADLIVALGVGMGFGAIASGIWALVSLVMALAVVRFIGRLALRKLRGLNGDALGAIEQLVETTVLVLGAAAAHEGVGVAWWA